MNIISQSALIESKLARDSVLELFSQKGSLAILNQTKDPGIATWKDDEHATTEEIAKYYEVKTSVAIKVYEDSRKEFSEEWWRELFPLREQMLKTRNGRDLVMSLLGQSHKEQWETICQALSGDKSWCDFLPDKTKHVYFVLDTEKKRIKIGYSSNHDVRFSSFKPANSSILRLLGVLKGGKKKESELHKQFNHLRHRGEWFKDCKEIRDYLSSFASANEEPLPFWTPRAAVRLGFMLTDSDVAQECRVQALILAEQAMSVREEEQNKRLRQLRIQLDAFQAEAIANA